HALYALVRYRGDAEAQSLAEAYIAEIHNYWNPADGWAVERLRALGLTYEPVQGPLNGETRMLGPLVKYYRATGSPAALKLALILGRHGWPEYYHDAERILRCHLLPSQLRDVSFMPTAPNPDNLDSLRDIPARLQGAFGVPAPYGHWPADQPRESIGWYMDIV